MPGTLSRKNSMPFAAFFLLGFIANFALAAPDVSQNSLPAGTRISVPVTFPDAGLASIGVYNAQGEHIRTLTSAKPVPAGAQTLDWDGTTDLGLPAGPGAYHVHGVWFAEPPKIDYVMKVGLSGKPPYRIDNDRGSWGGNLGPPMDICTNGKQLLAIFGCVEDNKTTGIQLMDLDGNITHRFTSFFGWDNRLACTMDDKNAYLAIQANSDKRLFIAKYDLDQPPRGKILCDIPAGDHSKTSGVWKGLWEADVRGLALNKGRLYVPVLLDDKLFVVDSETGKILSTASIQSPRGVTVSNGNIYILSGSNLDQIDENGANVGSPLITGLDDPSGVTADANGNFYISERGATQQVQVFSPDGKLLREIGVKGGRPSTGPYNPAGLLDPRGLCVTPDGKAWVTSTAHDFQEITVWDANGKRTNAFYNCELASGQGRLSPDRTEMLGIINAYGDNAGVTAYKLNFNDGTWSPSWHTALPQENNEAVFLGNTHIFGRLIAAFGGRAPYLGFDDGIVKGTNGKSYLVGGDFSIWLFDPVTKQAKLASLVYTHHAHKLPTGGYEGDYDQGYPNWLTWSDLNGDGKMSLDEVNYRENPPLLDHVGMLSGFELQPDLSILMLAGKRMPGGDLASTKWEVFRLKPSQVLPSGVPVYDWNDLQNVVELQVPDYKGGDGGAKDPLLVNLNEFRTHNGDIYVNVSASPKIALHMTGVDGDGWWASRNWRMSPMKFDMKTGQPAWLKMGHRAAGPARPGEMYYPGCGVAASIDGIDFIADTMSQVWAWTDDDLFLGRMYNDNLARGPMDANGLYVELVGTFAYKINGKTYLLTGDHGVSVHEVDIPKLTPIDGGTVQLTADLAAQAKPWDPDGPPPGKRPTYIARGIFDFFTHPKPTDPPLKDTRTITIDGKLDPAEWDGVPKMNLDLNGTKIGTVQILSLIHI